jgi:hypothetical protein
MQSLSRQHAVIQFRKTGEAFLYDLGSTHGTFLNGGAPIAPNTYKRLMAGDSIKFGVSSRTYVFEGGPDRDETPDSSALAKPMTSNGKNSSDLKDSANTPKDKEAKKPSSTGTVIPQAKRRFSQAKNISEDDEEMDAEKRMEAHLGRGRKSGGQNEEEEEDQGNVSDEERDNAELEMIAGYLGKEAIEGADGDDAFYDRTKSDQSRKRSQSVPDTYETLGVKIRVLCFVINTLKTRISQLDAIISKDSSRRSQAGEDDEVDALDAFMSGMSQTIEEEEEKEKRQAVLKDLQNELGSLTSLSDKLKPEDGGVQVSIVSTKRLETLEDTFYNELVERVTSSSGSLSNLSTKVSVPEPKRAKRSEPSESPSAIHSMPPPPAPSSTASSTTTYAPVKSAAPTPPSSMGPPKIVSSPDSKPAPVSSPVAEPEATYPAPSKKRERVEPKYDYDDDESYTTWQAPAGQSGDGKTSLNDKLGY